MARKYSQAFWQKFLDETDQLCKEHKRKEPPFPSDEKLLEAKLTNFEMNQLDEKGWGLIHYAALKGYVRSVERFVKGDSEHMLDLVTGDELRSTPLLLAVQGDHLETVRRLVELGARIDATNSQGHGVVELAAFKRRLDILSYLISLDETTPGKLSVWKRLVEFLDSEHLEECESAAACIKILTEKDLDACNHGAVEMGVKVLQREVNDETKLEVVGFLLNLFSLEAAKTRAVSAGALRALVSLLQASCSENKLVLDIVKAIRKLCFTTGNCDQALAVGAIAALVTNMEKFYESEIVVEIDEALSRLAEIGRDNLRSAIGNHPGAIQSLVEQLKNTSPESTRLILASMHAICSIARSHRKNQEAFVASGITAPLSASTKAKNVDLQLGAVQVFRCLAENNQENRQVFLGENGALTALLQLLKRNRQTAVQERTASLLWLLAEERLDDVKTMADTVGVSHLLDFINSQSAVLHLIGAEGLSALAQGAHNKRGRIGQLFVPHHLVRLFRSDREEVVLGAIRTMRHFCVGVGYVIQAQNQNIVAQSRGIKLLVALVVYSQNELIQAEASLTLACVTLGNKKNLEDLKQNLEFSFARVLKMMYSGDEMGRLLAGSALATFCYGNADNQRLIVSSGGVRFQGFLPHLQSEDEFYRCNGAFQVVVMAKMMPDEDQVVSSAAGIKILSDLLENSKNDAIISLTCDCIARLVRLKSGIPNAMIAIGIIDLLVNHTLSTSDHVRGCASVALEYLTFNYEGRRRLLQRCRLDPYHMKVLRFYAADDSLAPEFLDSWDHLKQVGLPPIDTDRPCLVSRKTVQYEDVVDPRLSLDLKAADSSKFKYDDGRSVAESDRTPNRANRRNPNVPKTSSIYSRELSRTSRQSTSSSMLSY